MYFIGKIVGSDVSYYNNAVLIASWKLSRFQCDWEKDEK